MFQVMQDVVGLAAESCRAPPTAPTIRPVDRDQQRGLSRVVKTLDRRELVRRRG